MKNTCELKHSALGSQRLLSKHLGQIAFGQLSFELGVAHNVLASLGKVVFEAFAIDLGHDTHVALHSFHGVFAFEPAFFVGFALIGLGQDHVVLGQAFKILGALFFTFARQKSRHIELQSRTAVEQIGQTGGVSVRLVLRAHIVKCAHGRRVTQGRDQQPRQDKTLHKNRHPCQIRLAQIMQVTDTNFEFRSATCQIFIYQAPI